MSPRADRPITVTRKVHRRRRRARAVMAITVVGAVVAATGYGAWQFIEENEYLLDERCQVTVGETEHQLTPAQTYSAAHLAAGAADRDMPVQAAIDALAISLQETELENRADPEDAPAEEADAAEDTEGDGQEGGEDAAPEAPAPILFAAGGAQWDAVDASNPTPRTADEFYQELSNSSRGEGTSETEWSAELGLDEAAEALSRPHNSSFYPQHGELARAFARPLTGMQPLGMTCQLSQIDVPGPDAEGLSSDLQATLPNLLGEEAIAVEGSGENSTMTVSIADVDPEAGVHDPVNEDSAKRGDPLWLVAQWAVAAAETYGVQSVHAGTHEWQRDTGRWERVEEVSDDAVEIGFSRE